MHWVLFTRVAPVDAADTGLGSHFGKHWLISKHFRRTCLNAHAGSCPLMLTLLPPLAPSNSILPLGPLNLPASLNQLS